MTFKIKEVLTKSKSSFTKLEAPSQSTLASAKDDSEEIAEMKRKAKEAKKAREAEEFTARHGFVSEILFISPVIS